MATVGIFLSSEERNPKELVEGAQRAEQAGSGTLWISDHYHPWPEEQARLDMLEEAVEVIRRLLTGQQVSHHGRHYQVENARLYTCPDTAPAINVSAFGPKSRRWRRASAVG